MILEKGVSRKRFFIEIVGSILGAAIIAIGISQFLLPTKLSSGGFSGIATITYYFFNMPMGLTVFLINLPFFIFSFYKLGKEYFIKSIIGTIALSFFIDTFDKFPALTQDRLLACVYGGVLVGIGTAIIFKVDSSTGGTEMVTNVVRKYNKKIKASSLVIIIDSIIVLLNIIFFGEIEIGLYSAIVIYINGKIIDIIFEGIYFTKLVFIISNKPEQISQEISNKIKRGTTGLYGKGMYTNEEKLVLVCAASRGDVSKVKQIAYKIDKDSFIVIANAREVLGEGFKSS